MFYDYLGWALRVFMEKKMGWKVALVKNEATWKIFRVDFPADYAVQDIAKGAVRLIKTFVETLALRTRQLQSEVNIYFEKEDFEEKYREVVATIRKELQEDLIHLKKYDNLKGAFHEELPGFIENKPYLLVELEKDARNEIYLNVKCLWDWEVREGTFLHKLLQLEELPTTFTVYLLESIIHVKTVEEIKKNRHIVTYVLVTTFSSFSGAFRTIKQLARSIVDIWYLYDDVRSYMKREEGKNPSGTYLSFLWNDYTESFKRMIEFLIELDRKNPDAVKRFFNAISIATDMIGYNISPERFYHYFSAIREAVEKGLL